MSRPVRLQAVERMPTFERTAEPERAVQGAHICAHVLPEAALLSMAAHDASAADTLAPMVLLVATAVPPAALEKLLIALPSGPVTVDDDTDCACTAWHAYLRLLEYAVHIF